jgi:O-antigen/teichoic acid export membrane protein
MAGASSTFWAWGSVGGRVVLSFSRLVIALLIVRCISPELYGAYSVLVGLIFIGEWLVDFGYSDIAVREIGKNPSQSKIMISSLFTIKLLQSVLAIFLLFTVAHFIHLPIANHDLLLGLSSIILHAMCLAYRAKHRVELTLHLDVLFESAGVILMLLAIFTLATHQSSLTQIMYFHLASKAVYLACNIIYSRKWEDVAPLMFDWQVAKALSRHCMPIGVAGLLVTLYDNLTPLILATALDLEAIATYNIAMRFLLPIAVISQAMSAIFFTLLANSWQDKQKFTATHQCFVELVCIISAVIFCGIFSSAAFCMSLFSQTLADQAFIVKLAALAIFAKAITISMSPPIVIANQQAKTLILTLNVVVINTLLIYLIAPRYGLIGVVALYVFVEIFITAIPLYILSQNMAKYRLRGLAIVKILCVAGAAVMPAALLSQQSGLVEGLASVTLFIVFGATVGIFSKEKLATWKNLMMQSRTVSG